MCSEEGILLAMDVAALVFDFLILGIIFSRLFSRELVKAPATLTTLVMGSA